MIDSTLEPGSITLGEGLVRGESSKEILFTTYLCHPSMANNELSGPLAQTALFSRLMARSILRYTYRFVYAPETIGDIVYLSRNAESMRRNMAGGAVLTMTGKDHGLMFETSGRRESLFDRAARNVLIICLINWSPLSRYPCGCLCPLLGGRWEVPIRSITLPWIPSR